MNDLNNMERQICIVFVLMLHWCCDKKNSHSLNTEFYKQYVITLDHFIYNTDSVKIETQKELIWYSAFTELFWVMFVCMYVIRCIDMIHQYLYYVIFNVFSYLLSHYYTKYHLYPVCACSYCSFKMAYSKLHLVKNCFFTLLYFIFIHK